MQFCLCYMIDLSAPQHTHPNFHGASSKTKKENWKKEGEVEASLNTWHIIGILESSLFIYASPFSLPLCNQNTELGTKHLMYIQIQRAAQVNCLHDHFCSYIEA